jgi:hypothetical protein
MVTPEALYYVQRVQIALLSARYAIPAIYWPCPDRADFVAKVGEVEQGATAARSFYWDD